MIRLSSGNAIIGQSQVSQSWHQPTKTVALNSFCIDQYEFPNIKGELPRANVDWNEAKTLCESIGKRLCTANEWERACRGLNGRRYSYGDIYDGSICNTPIQGSGPGESPPPVQVSGYYVNCHTPEGVFDLNGSMSEWVSDAWVGDPEPFRRRAKVDPKYWRTLKGGTMWSNTFYGQECTSQHGHQMGFKNIDDGFRCCAD